MQLLINLGVEIASIEDVFAICILENPHFSFYLVYLFDYLLDVYVWFFVLLHFYTFLRKTEVLYLICAHLFVLFQFSTVVLTHVILLHFAQQFLILSLGDFFTPDTHMGI